MYRPLIVALLLLAPVSRAQGFDEAPPTPAPPVVASPESSDTSFESSDTSFESSDTSFESSDTSFESSDTSFDTSFGHDTDGAVRLTDRGRTRYLFANNALMLRGGEGFFSQRELVLSMVSLGLTDFLTVTVGSALPLWLVDTRMVHLMGGLKVGGSVTEYFHLAVGLETAVFPFVPGGPGHGYAATTLGTPDANLTLSLGVPFTFHWGPQVFFVRPQFFIGTVGGALRMTNRLALVTEHWVLFGYTRPMLFNSLGLRILGERWGVDLGAVRIPDQRIPIPWVNFSWHWG